jgi:hypothetical protein
MSHLLEKRSPPPLPSLGKSPPTLPGRTWLGTLLLLPWWLYRGSGAIVEWLFGALSAMLGLAILAALPIVQFLTLGYLLEASGRVARSGRFRDGFIGIRESARIGGIVLCGWLLLLPARFVWLAAEDAYIIDPTAHLGAWRTGFWLLLTLTVLHIVAAIARGGRVRTFLWPFNIFWLIRQVWRGGFYQRTRDDFWQAVETLRLPYYFSLGFRGFLGAFAWLFLPVSLFALGSINTPGTILAGYLGAFLLMFVLLYLPFLQARLAAQNRFRAVFEFHEVRADFQRAPWAFSFALIITLLFALPLFLLKIEVIPREAAWLPSLVFIAFIFPARLLTGWALARAAQREKPRHWFWRWTGWLPLLPVVAFYVLIVFFTQYTSWNGVGSLFEQHPFLLPVPFFGM